jgi:uncharacterized protein YndB with AHSA1/START domain
MNDTTVTTPNALEIRVERIFDAPRAHVFSVWTDPKLIPQWWGDGTVVEEMDVRPGGSYRFRTAFGLVEGEYREVEAPERLVQTFQNHVQTLEFEDLGGQTKLTQTMRLRHDRGTRHDDAIRRRGRGEGRLRASGCAAPATGGRRVAANDDLRRKARPMKTMTCKQLGGPCDLPHHGNTANEVIKAQDRHLKAIVAEGDDTHRRRSARDAGEVEEPRVRNGVVQEGQA